MNAQQFAVREANRNNAAAATGYAFEQSIQERKAARKFAWASIDWRNLEPLAEDERRVDEYPAYLYIAF